MWHEAGSVDIALFSLYRFCFVRSSAGSIKLGPRCFGAKEWPYPCTVHEAAGIKPWNKTAVSEKPYWWTEVRPKSLRLM